MHWMPPYHPDSYYKNQLSWIEYFLKRPFIKNKEGNFIDVGTHDGDITDIFLKCRGSNEKIFCFEPNPDCFNKLKLKYYNYYNIHIYNYAVGDKKESTKFNIVHGSEGHSYIKTFDETKIKNNKITQVDVNIINLDSLKNIKEIKFIKIDAESYDFLVMKGAKNLISKYKPIILFEFSGVSSAKVHNYSPKDWYLFFKDLNYTLISPIQGHDERFIIKNFGKYTPDLHDILAIPNEDLQYIN